MDQLTTEIPDFEWNGEEMQELNIQDILCGKTLSDPVMAVCCGTLFNRDQLTQAVTKQSI